LRHCHGQAHDGSWRRDDDPHFSGMKSVSPRVVGPTFRQPHERRPNMPIITRIAAAATIGLLASAAPASAEQHQRPPIRTEPVAGVYNKVWYNYVADINEAEKELKSDLRRASDREDRADAWEEYEVELADADKDYVKAMRKRGYRVGRVTLLAQAD